MRHGDLMRVAQLFLRGLGAALLAWALLTPLLGLFGSETEATVTHVRRQGGERGEALPNRYTFIVSYRFAMPDGRVVESTTQMIGDYANIPALHAARPLLVRYVPIWPSINSLSIQAQPNLEHLLVAVVGWILLFGLWRRMSGATVGANRGNRRARPRRR
jgi:hypothetical protein